MIDWQSLVVAPCATVFGQSAQITWNGQIFDLTDAVFDEEYRETDASDGMLVTTSKPCLGINLARVNLGGQPVRALQGARALVYASPLAGGSPAVDTTYIVKDARSDSHGWALLLLNLAPVAADEPSGGGQDA